MCPSFGQLSLIWDLQVTLCPHTRPLTHWSLWSETEGLFLVIRQPATGHAQSIMAFHIMYRSTQTPTHPPTPARPSACIAIPTLHTSRRSRLSNKCTSDEDMHSFLNFIKKNCTLSKVTSTPWTYKKKIHLKVEALALWLGVRVMG